MKMNWQKAIVGILVMTAVIFIYQQFIQSMIATYTADIEAMLMGFPIAMGAVVYFLSDYLNKMFNK